MGWINANVKMNAGYENQNMNAYGTRSPIISDQFKTAYGNYSGAVSPSGANALQQGAHDTMAGIQNRGASRAALMDANQNLQPVKTQMAALGTKGPNLLGTAPRAVATRANASLADVSTSENAPIVQGRSAADFMDRYKDPYERDVVNAALADYDAGTASAYAAFKGANAGAFGNKRLGVAEAEFGDKAVRGRGSLSANLLSQGFNTRATLGQGDADRFQSADTINAGNILSNNQFNAGARNNASITNANLLTGVSQTNAGLETGVSQTNAGIQNDRDITDVNSRNQSDALAMESLTQQAGLTQQQAQNIVTADGIDTDMANALFAAGSITQSQLDSILGAAAQFNGSEFDERRSSNKTSVNVESKFGVG